MKKLTVKSPLILPVVFIATAAMMGTYETIKELIFKGALTPWESHTITIIVTSTIAVVTAALMRSWIISVHEQEKIIAAKEQSLQSHKMILTAVNHIVNNALNYLQVVAIEIDTHGKVSQETLSLLENSIDEASQQMDILNKIKDPLDPKSYAGIFPAHTKAHS